MESQYKVMYDGKTKYFPSLEAASDFCNRFFRRTGFVLGIYDVKRKRKRLYQNRSQ